MVCTTYSCRICAFKLHGSRCQATLHRRNPFVLPGHAALAKVVSFFKLNVSPATMNISQHMCLHVLPRDKPQVQHSQAHRTGAKHKVRTRKQTKIMSFKCQRMSSNKENMLWMALGAACHTHDNQRWETVHFWASPKWETRGASDTPRIPPEKQVARAKRRFFRAWSSTSGQRR